LNFSVVQIVDLFHLLVLVLGLFLLRGSLLDDLGLLLHRMRWVEVYQQARLLQVRLQRTNSVQATDFLLALPSRLVRGGTSEGKRARANGFIVLLFMAAEGAVEGALAVVPSPAVFESSSVIFDLLLVVNEVPNLPRPLQQVVSEG